MRSRIAAAWSTLAGGSAPAPRIEPTVEILDAAVDAPNGSITSSEAVRMGLFGPPGNFFGPAVTDSTAMQVGTVYACLAKLGGAVSQLPLHEYLLDQAGERQRVSPASPLWWLLNESPSSAWTASAWKQWIVRCVKLRGDQHTEIIRSRTGTVLGLKPHHPDCTQARTVGGRLRYDVYDTETGRAYGVDQDDMLHFTGFGFDGERSMSAIKWAARSAVASELGAAQYMGASITEGGMPRIALEMAGNLNEQQRRDLRQSFVDIYGGGDGGKLPLILANGAKAHELSISPVDLELLASRKFDKATICEVLGVPPIIVGDSEKTSSWGTGIEQITLGWLRFDISPMLCGWEEEMNRKLFRRAGRFVEFSLEGLMRGDSKAQAEAFRAALGGPGTGDGWMTVNEIRKLKNLPAIADPEADKPFRAQRAVQTPAQPATAP
jgi:HK97 family phage portal protein